MAQRIAVPDRVVGMGLLDRVDYGDAFTTEVPAGVEAPSTAEVAAERAVAAAPWWLPPVVRVAQRWVLGLRVAPAGPENPVLGWHLVHGSPHEAVYGVQGGLLTPRLVITTSAERVVVVTLLRYDSAVAAVMWAVVGPVHRRVARVLLDRGVRSVGSTAAGR